MLLLMKTSLTKMQTVHFSQVKKYKKGLSLGIGKFDGVHIGHYTILKAISQEAEKNSFVPAVFTFRNFPVEFMLCKWEEKIALIEKAGIKLCIWCDLPEISMMTAEEFLEMLSAINVKKIVVGQNFHFGAGRKGNISLLKNNEDIKNFQLVVVAPKRINGEIVNSTRIRSFIKNGEIEKANDFLGRLFFLEGQVVQGKKIGSLLGFPTANLALLNPIPISDGIYAGMVRYSNRIYPAVVHIGPSPTFNEKEKKFEVFIIDFKKPLELYGQTLKVFLFNKIRDIKKFDTEKNLKQQIACDVQQAKEIFLTKKVLKPTL